MTQLDLPTRPGLDLKDAIRETSHVGVTLIRRDLSLYRMERVNHA